MKILTKISQFLLGLTFFVYGLNGFLQFIPMPAPTGVAGEFMQALFLSKYLLVVSALEVKAGVSLLINRYVPLALAMLGPVVVNILLYHLLMDSSGLWFALFVALLWAVVFVSIRSVFAGIFAATSDDETDLRPASRACNCTS